MVFFYQIINSVHLQTAPPDASFMPAIKRKRKIFKNSGTEFPETLTKKNQKNLLTTNKQSKTETNQRNKQRGASQKAAHWKTPPGHAFPSECHLHIEPCTGVRTGCNDRQKPYKNPIKCDPTQQFKLKHKSNIKKEEREEKKKKKKKKKTQ